MSVEHKVGDRQRKSTGRRSSILKRQDTCYLTDVTEIVEKTNTPLKRRVSFANTAQVRTFEALPWQSHLSDDSGSSSVSHIENDVLTPGSSLLLNVKSQHATVNHTAVENNAGDSTRDSHDDEKEQNKTIMFSQFNESDCAMEITTNVSQLSHSWLDVDTSSLENDVFEGHHNSSAASNESRVSVPWNDKVTDNNDVEKTQIFLSSDFDNMEFTRNLTGFPSLSARFLESDFVNDNPHQENVPKQQDQEIVDDMNVDMEMTGVIETMSVPKRRSVLVDLMDNKNLTPIEEMSVSSMCASVSEHESSTHHKKVFNVSQVCAKLEALGSDKKSPNGKGNLVNLASKTNSSPSSHAAKSSSLCTSPASRAGKDLLSSTEKQDDREVSFKFVPFVGTSPESSRSKQNSSVVTASVFENSHGDESMEMTTTHLDDDQNEMESNNSSHRMEVEMKFVSPKSKNKIWQASGDFNTLSHVGQSEKSKVSEKGEKNSNSVQTTLYHETMEMTDCGYMKDCHSSGKSDTPLKTVHHDEDMTCTHNISAVDFAVSEKSADDLDLKKKRCSDEKIVFAGDMEMTSLLTHPICEKRSVPHIEPALSNSNRNESQKLKEISVHNSPGISDSFQETIYNTEGMTFTQNMSLVESSGLGEAGNDFDMERKGSSNEKTMFLGEMEMTSLLPLPAANKHVSNNGMTCELTAFKEVDSSRLEMPSGQDGREEMGSLHVSLLDKFLGSQEFDLHQSAIGSDAVESDNSLHDSISLSEIAGMKSLNNEDNPEKAAYNVAKVHSNDLKGGNGQSPKSHSQGDSPFNTFMHISKNSPVNGGETDDRIILGSQKMVVDHSISLSKLPSEEVNSEPINNININDSSLKSSFQDHSLSFNSPDGKFSQSERPSSYIEQEEHSMKSSPVMEKSINKEMKENPQENVQLSEQAKKRAALRKSLCNEMMFPNLASKSFNAKSFSNFSKPNKAKNNNSVSNEKELGLSKPDSQSKKVDNMRLSSDFFEGEGLLDEGDCPTLEDAFENMPLNESIQEELVFSYMHSIIEVPGNETDEKDSKQTENKEAVEFSDICQVMGIEYIAEQKQETVASPVPSASIRDMLNAGFVFRPQIATLESYVGQLQEEYSRKQKAYKENLNSFTNYPPQIYKDVKSAISEGFDVSSTLLKVQDMSKSCKGSTGSKRNRHTADYLMELTSAQQKGHEQQKKDLATILSDIERVANISTELDKCMEGLNVFTDTRSEIQHLQKKTTEIQSETCRMKSQCDKLDKDVEALNKSSKNCLYKMKDDEKEELLLMDRISFMSCLSEWSLLKQWKTKWEFGFLSNTVILSVNFSNEKPPNQRIVDISLRSRLSSKSTLWARISHQLLLSSVDREVLMEKCQGFQQVNLLIEHVSDLAGVSRDLCAELKEVHQKHHLDGDGLRIKIHLLSHECKQAIEVCTVLQSGLYSTQPLDWQTSVMLSPLSSTSVINALRQVTPGPKYITRSLEVVFSLM